MFTSQERKAIIFLCLVLLLGGLLKLIGPGLRLNYDGHCSKEAELNINEATLEELIKLPAIGEKTAIAIIKYRQENKGFSSFDDLKKVKGIGDKKLEAIRQFITF